MSNLNESLAGTKSPIEITKDLLHENHYNELTDELGYTYSLTYNPNALATQVTSSGEMKSRIHFTLIISLVVTNPTTKEQTQILTSKQEFGFNNQFVELHNCQIIHHVATIGFEDINEYYQKDNRHLSVLKEIPTPSFQEMLPVIKEHFEGYL